MKYKFKNHYIIDDFGAEEVGYARLGIYLEFEAQYNIFEVINDINHLDRIVYLDRIVMNLRRLIRGEIVESKFHRPKVFEPTSPHYWWSADDVYFCSTANETVAFYDRNFISYPHYQGLPISTPTLLEIMEAFIQYKRSILSTKPLRIYLNYELWCKYNYKNPPNIDAFKQYFRATVSQNFKLDILSYTFFSSYPDIIEGRELKNSLLHHHLIVKYPHDNFSYLMFLDREILLNIIVQLESLILSKRVAFEWKIGHVVKFIAKKDVVVIKYQKRFFLGKDNQTAPTIEVLQMLKDFIAYIESKADMPLSIEKDQQEYDHIQDDRTSL